MRSKIREELYNEDLIRASKQTPEEKLKEALELSELCLELKKAADKQNAPKKNS